MKERSAGFGSKSVGVKFVDVTSLQVVDFQIHRQAIFGDSDLRDRWLRVIDFRTAVR